MKIELSGIIKLYYDGWFKIKLVQESGYKVDLISRFIEIKESFPGASIQLSYYISDDPLSKGKIIKEFLTNLYGGITAEYDKNTITYSECTVDTEYDSDLRIGNHDLYVELSDKEDKFIYLLINVHTSQE
jgi:hypothetical protein